jgi:hypothetical protein
MLADQLLDSQLESLLRLGTDMLSHSTANWRRATPATQSSSALSRATKGPRVTNCSRAGCS